MINSREKGKVGEREFRDKLIEHGFAARRGVQYQGTAESPDISCPELPFHWEVKFGGRIPLAEAYRQAQQESSQNQIPIVAHRSTRRGTPSKWMVTLSADDFLLIIKFGPKVIRSKSR